jgi:PAS domain S-box-containing protein
MRRPSNERERVAKLRTLNVLDRELDGPFNSLVRLAAQITGCSRSFLSFIEDDRQIFRATFGFEASDVKRELSICAETLLSEEPLIITDLSKEARYSSCYIAQTPLGFTFYAGFPIITRDKLALGTLCVADKTPRQLSSAQIETLTNLATQIHAHLELHNKLSAVQRTITSLEDSEQRFRRIADASPVLLWISDQSGNRTLSNRAWCDFTGLTQEESLADCWRRSVHPDDSAVYQAKWGECARAHTKFQHEYRLRHTSGTYRWVLEQAIPLFSSNGRLEAYVSSCVDLSLRSSDELQYQHNEARFRAVSEAAPLGIVVTDSNGNCIYSNHRFQAISGLNPEQSLGSGWLRPIHSDDKPNIQLAWEEANRKAQSFERVVRYQRSDGAISWCSLKAAAINATDTVSGWVSTIEDITAKREAEEQLIAAKQAAEAAMHSKSQFLANMSHEIRTPLTAIIGFADALRQDGALQPAHNHCLDVILNNGRHLLSIINQILDLSKIDAGALTIEHRALNLIEMVEELRSMFAPTINEKSLKFNVDYRLPLPKQITTDPLRLKQVLINLLGNAIKFTSSGSVSLTVSWSKDSQQLHFQICDTGIGMSPEQIANLFTPFYQANDSSNRLFGGTGLGLSISQRLVRALGGAIEVSSRPESGSTFSFSIRSCHASTDTLLETQPIVPPPKARTIQGDKIAFNGTILFADDALDNRRLVELLLRRTGADVVLVENGQEAIEAAKARPFDLILMDIQMPVVDGLSATKRIREAGIETPIVAISAGAMTTDVEQALAAGCCMHLSKPFERHDFYKMVSKYLKSKPDPSPALTPLFSQINDSDPDLTLLVSEFARGLPPRDQELRDAFKGGNLQRVAALAHKLKGSAGMYGYPELAEVASVIDKAAKRQDPAAISAELPKLKLAIDRIEYGMALNGTSFAQTSALAK